MSLKEEIKQILRLPVIHTEDHENIEAKEYTLTPDGVKYTVDQLLSLFQEAVEEIIGDDTICRGCKKPIDGNHFGYEGSLECPIKPRPKLDGNWTEIGENRLRATQRSKLKEILGNK